MADDLAGARLMAATAEIRRLADATGSGSFLSDAGCQQWAELILMAVDAVEAVVPAAEVVESAEPEPLTA
jgi:hypothetical protein